MASTTPRFALALAAAVALAGGAAAYVLLRAAPEAPPPDPDAPRVDSPRAGVPPSVGSPGEEARAPETPAAPAAEPSATPVAGVPPGLRTPSGEDLSDLAVVDARLRAAIAKEPRPWDEIGDLVAVHPGPLPGDVRVALERALVGPEGRHAALVYERVGDPSVVSDLLDLLSDASLDFAARARVLRALAKAPGGDRDVVVRGIEARLTGDPQKDEAALAAIAERGGPEGARVLVEVLSGAPDELREAAGRWSLPRDAATDEALAKAIADPERSAAARAAAAALAARPGASAGVVEAIVALEGAATDDAGRKAMLLALARTGSPVAVEHLLAAAAGGGTRGADAAAAISETTSASREGRARLVKAALEAKDPAVRRSVVRALGTLGEEGAVPALAGFLAEGDDDLRKESVVALGQIGAKAAPAVPSLARAFDAGDDVTRRHVAVALGRIGTPEAESTLRQLRVAASSPDVRRAIATALASIGRR